MKKVYAYQVMIDDVMLMCGQACRIISVKRNKNWPYGYIIICFDVLDLEFCCHPDYEFICIESASPNRYPSNKQPYPTF